jgi:NAD(P)-dependent dehydrogenase (short-subunit alcohol dehydrogenase family)
MILEPKIAVITGATDGIGKARAVKLLKEGWEVAIIGRSIQRCETTVRELKVITGSERGRLNMCNAEQSGFDFNLIASFQHKSFEAFIVFNITKDRLNVTGSLFSVFDAFFAE